ncbi:Interferon developmental regulator [Paragonimus heterotremus]|uniref:Interferon developmental regulator n=1 Tax=Paragonimus heterotremus TaxID=100268 RepID=A0A8J4WLC2_9TREM|nr:Interferon developmental regulator [Paragonimus heterotremus]
MPKKKVKSGRGRTDDGELDHVETASVNSLASEESETLTYPSLDVDDVSIVQCVIDKVNSAIEALTEKRPETRIKALSFLIEAFRKHHLCLDESWNYAATFFNGIEGILKKGKAQDQTLATECLSIFCLQFDTNNIAEHFLRFLPILDTVLRDSSEPCSFRTACATALSVFQLLAGHCDFVSPKDLMKSFEFVFKGSCLKGDGKAPVLEPHVSLMHLAALRAWGLIYTFLAPYDVSSVGQAMIPTLISLLRGNNVDMRILAGETAALIYERIRTEVDERFKGPHYTDLIRLLNDLATDGTKSRSKVDRKKQRHSFRDLVDAVTRSDASETSINVGSEVLVLTSCTDHYQYDLLCYLLKGGMCRHLQENCLVRDLFDLGLPVVISHNPLDRRSARDQRRLTNTFASKMRTQKLCSYRDRRSNLVRDSD